MNIELGIIEGYYGTPWSMEARARTIEFLGPIGYRFFIYAPKFDSTLRRTWREPTTGVDADRLAAVAAACKGAGVRFGVGLSPLGAERDFSADMQRDLAGKLAFFDELGVDILAILFDDRAPGQSDLANRDLANRQVKLMHWVAARTKASRAIMCPTYYSDDPRLDRMLGARPANYLEHIGHQLAPAIEVFWTGPQVCARTITVDHLERVGRTLRRKPTLWDNYPVNDGARMSPFLHLRAFTGRPAAIADLLCAHAINLALQPTLTQIPALTLADAYQRGDRYVPRSAFNNAALQVLGVPLVDLVAKDLTLLQDIGLDRLGAKSVQLRERYAAIDHPAAREIVAWLDGAYRFSEQIA